MLYLLNILNFQYSQYNELIYLNTLVINKHTKAEHFRSIIPTRSLYNIGNL